MFVLVNFRSMPTNILNFFFGIIFLNEKNHKIFVTAKLEKEEKTVLMPTPNLL
jgi:hypothetical protein